jgi:hypothetical protein
VNEEMSLHQQWKSLKRPGSYMRWLEKQVGAHEARIKALEAELARHDNRLALQIVRTNELAEQLTFKQNLTVRITELEQQLKDKN